ncbi:4-amino-4-deoxy-L-arabinose-phospho-UDP flippase subunit F [Klebsiella pneumoniae]|nr:4-amino-4-deoxy-L-arabinose-phospho-UDP flippase subunit F [Klebsiella pneumoniae]
MGFFWALLSVGLVSAAQLLLRSAMVALPPLTDIVAFLQHLLHFQPGLSACFSACWATCCRWSAGTLPSIACRCRKRMRY